MSPAKTLVAFALLLIAAPAVATVAEQRARLPPPKECEDPIVGIWRAHQFVPAQGTWYVRTLDVRRADEGSETLTGLVWSEYWYGTTKDQEAPSCGPGGRYHAVIRMPAVGTYHEGQVAFGGTSWTLDRLVCGGVAHGYNPDRFSGTVDPKLQEFQSVNNDGGLAVNEPVVFRRIQCFDDPEPVPTVSVVPPPIFRASREQGCRCALGVRQRDATAELAMLGAVLLVAGAARRRARRRSR